MTKASKIKEYLIEKSGLQEHHFEVDIEGISRGSLELKTSFSDIKEVNKYFETRVHSVKISENWYSVSLIGEGIGDALIIELNIFLENVGEEIITLDNNQYSSIDDGLIDVHIVSNGNETKLSLAWRIEN